MARITSVEQQPQYTSTAKMLNPPNPESGGTRVIVVSKPVFESRRNIRDDVHRSAVNEGFRPPLGYYANGFNSSSAGIALSGVMFAPGDYQIDYSIYGTEGGDVAIARAPAPHSLISSSDIDRAVIGMLKQIGDQKWSAGQMIAELQGSIDTIAGAANRIQTALFASLKKDWRGVARALGVPPKKVKSGASAADGWLQYQFGWVPLVDDIANSALFLSGYGGRGDSPIIMAKSRLNATSTQSDLIGNRFFLSLPFGALASVHFTDKTVFTDEWQASLYYEMDISWLNGLARYGLLGLSTPWAVVPYSFLVDWLLPIGDYLAAWDATLGLTYKGGSFTRFKRAQTNRRSDLVQIHNDNPKDQIGGTVYWPLADNFDMVRTPWASSPLPFPGYIKNPFSTFKAVTSIALLKQIK